MLWELRRNGATFLPKKKVVSLGLQTFLIASFVMFTSELNPCPVSEHTCNNLQCIPRDKVCNGYDDCGDGSDEKVGCTPCNVTYYGEVGKSYEIEVEQRDSIRPPFTCHLTFVAAGDIYGDLVQIVFRDISLGTFRSHHVCGCPQGHISIDEARRPHIEGFWCGGSSLHNVYYSETSTATVTLKIPPPEDNYFDEKPFKVLILYKFLLGAEAIVRYGPWNSAKYLGVLQQGTLCDQIFDSCDRRKCRIQSPNYPGIYPRNITCKYLIRQATVPHGRHALVSIGQLAYGKVHVKHTDAVHEEALQLYYDAECDIVGDTLSIYEIINDKKRLLLQFCGGGKIPRITGSSAELMLVFQTSPYDNMYFDPSVGTHPGFELDVGVAFVPKNSFLYSDKECKFKITSFESLKGHFENVAHSLPKGTTCIYEFHGRPEEVVWLYFTRLKLDNLESLSRDTPHCKIKITMREGLKGDGPILENTCGHLGVRVCHLEQLGPGRNRTRPCGIQESYLTSTPNAVLTIQYVLPSAISNLNFRLHYEFVYAGPLAQALTRVETCDRYITSQRSKKGLIVSPANNLLYGKFGATTFSCKYTLTGQTNEAVRLTFIEFFAFNSTCPGGDSPLQACGNPTNPKRRGARLEVSEYPWEGVELPLACLCHGASLPAALLSFSSKLSIDFIVSGMTVFDDYSHFSFEIEYEFVEVEECIEERIVQGEAGVLSLYLQPPKGPCRGHPWLLRPAPHRFLMVSVPGKEIARNSPTIGTDHLIENEDPDVVYTCEGPELHIYQPGNPVALSAICVQPGLAESAHVFSQGFTEPWSLDYLEVEARSLVIVLLTRHSYLSKPSPYISHDSVEVQWVEAAPKWLASRCSTECPLVHACISASLFCDGTWHCPSGSDEAIGTCLLALSPWLWLFFGLTIGSFVVLVSWWLCTLWKRKKMHSFHSHRYGEHVLTPGHQETPPEPPEMEFQECVEVDYETTV